MYVDGIRVAGEVPTAKFAYRRTIFSVSQPATSRSANSGVPFCTASRASQSCSAGGL